MGQTIEVHFVLVGTFLLFIQKYISLELEECIYTLFYFVQQHKVHDYQKNQIIIKIKKTELTKLFSNEHRFLKNSHSLMLNLLKLNNGSKRPENIQ